MKKPDNWELDRPFDDGPWVHPGVDPAVLCVAAHPDEMYTAEPVDPDDDDSDIGWMPVVCMLRRGHRGHEHRCERNGEIYRWPRVDVM